MLAPNVILTSLQHRGGRRESTSSTGSSGKTEEFVPNTSPKLFFVVKKLPLTSKYLELSSQHRPHLEIHQSWSNTGARTLTVSDAILGEKCFISLDIHPI